MNYVTRIQEAPKDLAKAEALTSDQESDEEDGFVSLNSFKKILPSFFKKEEVIEEKQLCLFRVHNTFFFIFFYGIIDM